MRKIVILLVGIILLGMVGFWVYGLVKSNHVSGDLSIEKDHAKSLDVDIEFGAGELLIEGGAEEWVDGYIDTNVKKWYPSVTYKNKRDVGYVEIHQKMKGFSVMRKNRNDWNLQLTNEIPVNLDVEMGVSEAELNLAGIRLRHLSIDAGVGDTTINLQDDWLDSFDVEIDLGVGDAEIHLPNDIGVKLSVSKGIGRIATEGFISKGKGVYVNEAYDHSETKIDLKIDIGVGDVKILLAK
ncbi:toast rack family protein [Sporosarcina obsidiansis]|uniref:toast rack family protein n=1 Tax=Sporosarcina obsidiansis TaxID=2660748 RepID=UPI00129AD6A0|nr:toast rack family protein [Sporosarcina obsidiansis]